MNLIHISHIFSIFLILNKLLSYQVPVHFIVTVKWSISSAECSKQLQQSRLFKQVTQQQVTARCPQCWLKQKHSMIQMSTDLAGGKQTLNDVWTEIQGHQDTQQHFAISAKQIFVHRKNDVGIKCCIFWRCLICIVQLHVWYYVYSVSGKKGIASTLDITLTNSKYSCNFLTRNITKVMWNY